MGTCFLYGKPGGGGVKIKVLGGTSAPAAAEQNALWVQTGVSVTDYVLSPVQPGNPGNGFVWLRSGVEEVNFCLDKNQKLRLNICGAFQYVDGTWKSVSVNLRTEEGWQKLTNARYDLFLSGEGMQNGHTLSVVDCSNGEFGVSDKIYLGDTNDTDHGHLGSNVTFLPSVDLTGFNTLHIGLSVHANGDADFIAGVGPDRIPNNGVDGWPSGSWVAGYMIKSGDGFTGTVEIDLSNVSGKHYVKFRGYRSYGYISDVWLD